MYREPLAAYVGHSRTIAHKIDVQKLWKVIDSMPSPQPEIMHKLFREDGLPTRTTKRQIIAELGTTQTRLDSAIGRTQRELRTRQHEYVSPEILAEEKKYWDERTAESEKIYAEEKEKRKGKTYRYFIFEGVGKRIEAKQKMTAQVEEYLGKGWELYGEMSVVVGTYDNWIYSQVMVRRYE
jgi:hypothetical protein